MICVVPAIVWLDFVFKKRENTHVQELEAGHSISVARTFAARRSNSFYSGVIVSGSGGRTGGQKRFGASQIIQKR